jgi:hypothetical protein
MSGFSNETVYGINADFTSVNNQNVLESNGLATNGQLWIGTTSVNAGGTHINVGSITSPNSSITLGYSSPNITLQVNGSLVGQTITGNSGGALSPTLGNWNIVTANSTVTFQGVGSTLSLDFNDALNLGLGSSYPSLTTGVYNTSVGGLSLSSLTGGLSNTMAGYISGQSITTGSQNCGVGVGALLNLQTGSNNSAYGLGCFQGLTSGGSNSGLGINCGSNLLTGSFNIIAGFQSGTSYTTSESSNILLSNNGVIGESNTIRIGTQGSSNSQQNQTFIAGISGVTVAASTAVLIDANGQLGTILSSQRFKENIEEFESKDILKLRPVTFNYISDKTKEVNVGLIAEEVYEILPDLVILDLDKKPYSVKYDQIIMYLLSEVKKLHKLISKE